MNKSGIINSAGVVTVIFRKTPGSRGDPAWSYYDAINYLNEHNIKPQKYHSSDNFHRFRILSPAKYNSFYTVEVTPGVLAIIGMK